MWQICRKNPVTIKQFPGRFMTDQIREKVALVKPGLLIITFEQFKTQKMSEYAVFNYCFTLQTVPNSLNVQKMCKELFSKINP